MFRFFTVQVESNHAKHGYETHDYAFYVLQGTPFRTLELLGSFERRTNLKMSPIKTKRDTHKKTNKHKTRKPINLYTGKSSFSASLRTPFAQLTQQLVGLVLATILTVAQQQDPTIVLPLICFFFFCSRSRLLLSSLPFLFHHHFNDAV